MKEKVNHKKIQDVRMEIIDTSLIFGFIVGCFAYLFSLNAYFKDGFQLSFVTDLLVILTLSVIVYRRKKLSIHFKAYVLIAAVFLVMSMDMIRLGIYSADRILIVLIPFLAILVFSIKRTMVIFILALLMILIIGWFHVTGRLSVPTPDPANIFAWVINILLITIVAFVVLTVTSRFNKTYEHLIDDLVLSNKDLEEQERNYREIFNSTSDAIFIHDLDGKILDVNNTMLNMYGYTQDEIRDLSINELSEGSDLFSAEKAGTKIQKALDGDVQVFDWLARRKNGEHFWAEVVLKRSNIGGKDRILAIVRDIDEKKKAEIELERHQQNLEEMVRIRTEKLIESEKMASVGVLAAGVAHEINNPLNFIQGGVNGLDNYFRKLTDKEKRKQVHTLIDGVRAGVHRAASFVTSLNHYSRQDDAFDDACDIHRIIDNCLVMLKNQTRHKIKINKTFSNEVMSIKGNEGRLHQVFINILYHAIQALNEKGMIRIGTRQDDGMIRISISDNGKEERYVHLHENMDDQLTDAEPVVISSLGLSISRKIINDHNGRILFMSKTGVGNEVLISLPSKPVSPDSAN